MARRVFKTRHFDRWMRTTGVMDAALCKAVVEMVDGLVEADLGGGVMKKRVPLPGRGKSGGARTLAATNKDDRWFFVYGFEKSERANMSAGELKALKEIATDLLKLSSKALDAQVNARALHEICHERET